MAGRQEHDAATAVAPEGSGGPDDAVTGAEAPEQPAESGAQPLAAPPRPRASGVRAVLARLPFDLAAPAVPDRLQPLVTALRRSSPAGGRQGGRAGLRVRRRGARRPVPQLR